jgi:hypothetical protein
LFSCLFNGERNDQPDHFSGQNIVREARIRAIGEGTSVSAKVREFLAQYANVAAQAAPSQPLNLPIFRGGGGLLAGIDPCSNKSMLDAADGFVDAAP